MKKENQNALTFISVAIAFLTLICSLVGFHFSQSSLINSLKANQTASDANILSIQANTIAEKANQISSDAIFTSKEGNYIAAEQRDVANLSRLEIREIEKLDIHPRLVWDLTKYKGAYYLHIRNRSINDAIQVEIQINHLRYDSTLKKIRIYSNSFYTPSFIDRVSPHDQHPIKLPMSAFPPEQMDAFNSVVEICIIYRRNPDLKQYGYRSFYFYTGDGNWVTENNTLIEDNRYDYLKIAAHNSTPCFGMKMKWHHDPSYPLDRKILDSAYNSTSN